MSGKVLATAASGTYSDNLGAHASSPSCLFKGDCVLSDPHSNVRKLLNCAPLFKMEVRLGVLIIGANQYSAFQELIKIKVAVSSESKGEASQNDTR